MDSSKQPPGSSVPRLQWETDDEVLAYYLAIARYGGKDLPHTVQEELERIALAAGSNPVFAARLHEVSLRMDQLDGEGASSAFERLTGQSLSGASVESQVDRPPHRAPRRRRVGRMTTLAGLSMLAVGILFWGGHLLRPAFGDLAALEPELEMTPSAMVLRGRTPTEQDLALERFRQARDVLGQAESRWLGIVRRYDHARVKEAMVLLDDARSMTTPDAPAYAAASYLLAKAYLAADDVGGARRVLRDAAAGSGPYAIAAVRLEEQIEKRVGPAAQPPD